jgi:trehalose-6-phosphate synthase
MRRMRAMIREHNVYRWAGDLISELAKVRLETAAAGMPEEPVAEIDRYTAVSRINRAAG